MKMFVYSYRPFDEAAYFEAFGKEYGIQIGWTTQPPTPENARLAEGSQALSVLTTVVDEPLLRQFRQMGIKLISTRTIGYDHIDTKAASQLGIHVSNASYTPECVADYTIMLMLMAIRKMKRIMQRAEINDFTLKGIQGSVLSSHTVGIVGTGKIGRMVAKFLSGFGCRVYACDPIQDPQTARYAQYTDLERIFEKCSIITLHMPLTQDNFHMINKESISRMKEGVVLINTARGSLIDTNALIQGLEEGKIGAAALDVVENEFQMYYYDRKSDLLNHRELSILRGFPNVIVTPHMAFYTDRSVSDMVECSVKALWLMEQGKPNPWQVV